MGKSNIIEINGRRYDAHSGQPLDGPLPPTERQRPVTGTVRPAASKNHTAAQSQPAQARGGSAAAAKPVSAAQPAGAGKVRVHEAVKARPQTRRQQRSTTLMRSAVTKPGDSLKRHAAVQSSTDALADQPAAHLQPKPSVRRVDDKRLRHASQVARSQAVSRFGHFGQGHEPAPQPPVQLPARQPKPAEFPASHLGGTPPPERHAHRTLDDLNDLVEHALQQATSHLEVAPAPSKSRLFWRFGD